MDEADADVSPTKPPSVHHELVKTNGRQEDGEERRIQIKVLSIVLCKMHMNNLFS